MFKLVIKKFDKYLERMEVEKPVEFNEDHWTEVRRRLQQLDWLYNLISRKHSKCMELVLRETRRQDRLRREVTSGSLIIPKSSDSRGIDRMMFQIELHTESFYYLAFRVRKILRHGSLPGLKSFESRGVRNVRNKLLEHPDKSDSLVLAQSFGIGGEEGPRLKADRSPEQEEIFPDAGLWVNAQEFRNNFEKILDAVLRSKVPVS